MPDPRLNCAAEICCGGPPGMRATVSILSDLGCPDEYAPAIARKMKELGIVFLSADLARAIAEIVQHPGRVAAEEEGG